ncbi:hypothetical protein GD1_19 [Paraglaciecola Antarctic GD virus 1]|nr:hypothetical protein GD1_19 [Paraglaciecola Antarctic GD virus 1]
MNKFFRNVRSFWTMQRKQCLFFDIVSGNPVFLYVDCYGVEWMGSFNYCDRMLRND